MTSISYKFVCDIKMLPSRGNQHTSSTSDALIRIHWINKQLAQIQLGNRIPLNSWLGPSFLDSICDTRNVVIFARDLATQVHYGESFIDFTIESLLCQTQLSWTAQEKIGFEGNNIDYCQEECIHSFLHLKQ
jgi:hypothetical protein